MYPLHTKRKGVGHVLAIAGLIILVAGLADALVPACTGPYCTSASTSIGMPYFTCTPSQCTAIVPVTNNNVTEQVIPFYRVTNSLGQTVALLDVVCGLYGITAQSSGPSTGQCQPVTIAQGTTQELTVTFGSAQVSLGDGGYSFTAFMLDAEGYPVSTSVSTPITSSTYQLMVLPGGGTVAVSVAGSPIQFNVCPVSATCGPYAIPANAIVTLTGNNFATTGPFVDWQFSSGGQTTSTSTKNPVTFTMDKSYSVLLNAGCLPTDCISIVANQAGSAVITPNSAQVFSSSAYGATSVTFTVQGLTVQGGGSPTWDMVCGSQVVPFPGTVTGSTAVITYAQAQATVNSAACGGGTQALGIDVQVASQPTLTVQDSAVYPGELNLSPTPGSYVYSLGKAVKVNATNVATGYQLTGWDVDGLPTATGQTSVTVTVKAGVNTVSPIVLKEQPSGGGGGGGGSKVCNPLTFAVPTNAGITVTVVDGTTGKPIGNATVNGGGQSDITNPSGVAVLSNIAVPNSIGSNKGTVTVTVAAPGYGSASTSVQVVQGQCSSAGVQLTKSIGIPGSAWLPIGAVGIGAVLVGADVAMGKKKGAS